ncbi:ATP adenylyltransferase family protein [Corallococcus exiguus]|uniref:ATP adenylyltransferase n=1 Tax=Corallococcus exiguus TaxID=83462 RepID=A0A7X5BTM0_9BACT|nr:ATP adenylyltransferase [Corallococcus exiguus]NBC43139.1 ATP adenylyltransferase [Corallococcus exiguus]TNV66158.1 ATP adenylyltransferase [Corallococcus exiguus]
MNATPLTPAALWPRTLDVTRHALETGALQPIATEARTVPVAGTEFQVRVLGRVALKERKRPAPSGSEPFNPFANPEPDLVLGDVAPAHVCLLNKFNVVEHHLLLVTRAFESQDALLTPADFDALSTCLEGLDGLAFYNAGETAGASQRHKHLQLVPPLGPDRLRAPVEALFPVLPGPGRVVAAESLPFAHLLAGLGPWGAPGQGARMLAAYRLLRDALGLAEHAPYNLLVTRDWMLLVPRSRAEHLGVNVNALGFAGSLLVRTPEQFDAVAALGPLELLRQVAGVTP